MNNNPVENFISGKNSQYQDFQSWSDGPYIFTAQAKRTGNNKPVVIKAINEKWVLPAARVRAESEAVRIRRIKSPHLPQLLEFERNDNHLFSVFEYVAGPTLKDTLATQPLLINETVQLGITILKTLEILQKGGVWHRNIKPTNIILGDPIRLIDIGFIEPMFYSEIPRDQILPDSSDIFYMAPEKLGVIESPTDIRSDLYSLGLVLFECLMGRRPFQAQTFTEILECHLSQKTPDLKILNPDIPESLNLFISHLLKKDPVDRYQTLQAALSDLQEINSRIHKGQGDEPFTLGKSDVRDRLTEPQFTGRYFEFQQIESLMKESKNGGSGFIFIEAESGGGKTSLLEEVQRKARILQMDIYRGQGVDAAAARPYQLLTGVVNDFIEKHSKSPHSIEPMSHEISTQKEILAACFPKLASHWDIAPDLTPNTEFLGTNRSISAVSNFLHSIGTGQRPALIILDDCQWMNELDLKLLRELTTKLTSSKNESRLLVILAYRAEEKAVDERLKWLNPLCKIRLGAMKENEIENILFSMAGMLPPEIPGKIQEVSGGNPFMAISLLHGMVETGILKPGPSKWVYSSDDLSLFHSSTKGAELLIQRIDRLPINTVHILSAGAVLGKNFSLKMAVELTEISLEKAKTAINAARSRQMVWLHPNQDDCHFLHDKIRMAFLNRLRPEERQSFHLKAASIYEKKFKDFQFELAYHFDSAGQNQRAGQYALAAAEQARSQNDFQTSSEQYEIAEKDLSSFSDDFKYRIYLGHGDVLVFLGKYETAISKFSEAIETTQDLIEKSNLYAKIGMVNFKRGNISAAYPYLEKSLATMGFSSVPKSALALGFLLIWEGSLLAFRKFIPRRESNRPLDQISRLRIELYRYLSHCYWYNAGTVRTILLHFKTLRLVESYQPSIERIRIYANHMASHSIFSTMKFARQTALKAHKLNRQLFGAPGEGLFLAYYGIILNSSLNLNRCIRLTRKGLRQLQKLGDYWTMNMGRFQVALALLNKGNLQEALSESKAIYNTGLEIGDIHATGYSLDTWARASKGDIPEAIIKKELIRPRFDSQVKAQIRLAYGVTYFYQSNFVEAERQFRKGIKIFMKSMMISPFVTPLISWLVSALRARAQNTSPLAPRERKQILQKAIWWSRLNLLVTWLYPADAAHARREHGLLLAMRGDPRSARHWLNRSIFISKKYGQREQHALSLIEMGRIGKNYKWPKWSEMLVRGQSLLSKLEITSHNSEKRVTVSIVDRFGSTLEEGRNIAAAQSRGEALRAIHQAAQKLIRGERCTLFTLNASNGELEPAFEAQPEADEIIIARKVLQTGEPVIYSDSSSPSNSPHLILQNNRSAIGAPIFLDEEMIGCFVLTHRLLSSLFGAEEKRLATYISTLGAAALHNAKSFETLQQMNDQLESRVEERTRELKSVNKKLAHLTMIDPMTTLWNRRGIENNLEKLSGENVTPHPDFLSVLVDIDDFKSINDKLGYSTGDTAIKETANIIRESIRETDLAARVGGDEFLIILPQTRIAEGKQIAERIRVQVGKAMVSGPSGFVRYSISIGITRNTSSHPTLDDLLAQVHLALRRSKHEGKNRISIHDENSPELSLAGTEENQYNALERIRQGKALYAVVMPINELADPNNRTIGYEFLIRSIVPGYTMPDEFFSLCRESDVLTTIDFECFKTCLKEAQMTPKDARIYLNLFPYTMVNFPVEHFTSVLPASISPSRICIEVSEQQIIGDPTLISKSVDAFKERGFRIAMDDVGFGRSNLETFLALEPNVVKIDKRFVQGISSNKTLQRFVQRTIHILKDLGTEIVAEGIEKKEDLDYLRSIGVQYGQGYIWGLPARLEEYKRRAA